MKDPRDLTPAEFELMAILWRAGEARSVAEVLAVVRSKRGVAYTTVMTLLDKMARKRALTRVKKGKAYFYQPAIQAEEALAFLVGRFAEHYFEGGAEALREFLGKRDSRKRQPSRNSPAREEMDVCLL